MALIRVSPSLESSARVRSSMALGGSGGSSRPIASARYRFTSGSDVGRRFERLDQLGAERPVGADLGVGHQARQLVGRRPSPVGSAVAHLGEVVLRAAVVGEQRTESDIHGDRDSNDGQRDQKELNGQGGRGDQWVASRVFALDEFVHEWESGRDLGMPESVQVLPPESLSGQAAFARSALRRARAVPRSALRRPRPSVADARQTLSCRQLSGPVQHGGQRLFRRVGLADDGQQAPGGRQVEGDPRTLQLEERHGRADAQARE